MREKRQYLKGTAKVLKANAQEKQAHKVCVAGKNFLALPNVFSPKHFNDTEFFAKEVPKHVKGDFLEIGPGTGAVAVCAAEKAERAAAVDLNPDAVRNTRMNAELHKVKIDVRKGDVYDALAKDECFDVIFWNTPFGYVKTQQELTLLERAVFDPGYKGTRKFIKDARKNLKQGGKLLIGFSTTLGDMELLQQLCEEAGFRLRLLAQVESEEDLPVKFELFEAKIKE